MIFMILTFLLSGTVFSSTLVGTSYASQAQAQAQAQACFRKYWMSLLTADLSTCNFWAISLML
jgi:hypothetical protein